MMSRASFSAALATALICLTVAHQGKPAPAQGKPAPTPTSTQAIPASALALVPKSRVDDTLHVETHIGSFKMVPKGPSYPAGKLEFTFQGTVLVSGLVPGSVLQTSGDVHEEFNNKEHGKQVFFGRGKLLIVGSFRNCEWFGRDLNLTFTGSAIIRIIAEFDKNRDTGLFWFDPAQKLPLQVTLLPLEIPKPQTGALKAILRDDYEKQQKKKGG
jgi:hypothetical protein